MAAASERTVRGDFHDAKLEYAGVTTRFFQRDGKYFARTDGPDGQVADFEVKYTFGVEPLQQYLIELPRGRMQALSIAWDSRPKGENGQRWFHLHPGERVTHTDELHWTQPSQNWNYMCADCHSTGLRKNYDRTSDQFRTSWSEVTVGCEACHGPGSRHVTWASAQRAGTSGPRDSTKGLIARLDERRGVRWTTTAATGNAHRSQPRATDREIETCAQCHARRAQIADGYVAGKPFLDYYRPALLSRPLYHADGQQRDEVYDWGSFLQSRMYARGVTCSPRASTLPAVSARPVSAPAMLTASVRDDGAVRTVRTLTLPLLGYARQPAATDAGALTAASAGAWGRHSERAGQRTLMRPCIQGWMAQMKCSVVPAGAVTSNLTFACGATKVESPGRS